MKFLFFAFCIVAGFQSPLTRAEDSRGEQYDGNHEGVDRDTVPCPEGWKMNRMDFGNSFGDPPDRYKKVLDYEVRCVSDEVERSEGAPPGDHSVSRDTVPCPKGMRVNRFELGNSFGEAPEKHHKVLDYEVRCVNK
jgi:hypothetical protein